MFYTGGNYMENCKQIDTRKSIRTVTSNNFITASGLSSLSLKARKILYIAISQCKMNDEEFYSYEITVNDFAELMGIEKTHVYQEADKITDELMRGFLRAIPDGEKSFRKYAFFSMCDYQNDGLIKFKLSPDMTNFLLLLKDNFTKPLLDDFLKMRSPYSMAIWHIMQREMHSCKPGVTNTMEFDLSLDELREVTGTTNKLKQIGQFKERVLDKALREINDNCGVKIEYINLKEERNVIGFHFFAVSKYHVNEEEIPQNVKNKCLLFQLKQKAEAGTLNKEEKDTYDKLVKNTKQLEIVF